LGPGGAQEFYGVEADLLVLGKSLGGGHAVGAVVGPPEAQTAFNGLRDRVSQWVDTCNATLSKQDLPISVAAHRSTWCIKYHQPSAYQFMFQYYLRDAGLQMAWVGTSKMLFSLEFSEADFKRLTEILVAAATAMKADGWWEEDVKPVGVANLCPLFLGPTLAYHAKAISSFLGLTS